MSVVTGAAGGGAFGSTLPVGAVGIVVAAVVGAVLGYVIIYLLPRW